MARLGASRRSDANTGMARVDGPRRRDQPVVPTKEHTMALLGVVLLLLGIGAGATAFVAARSTASTLTVTAFGFSRNVTALELVLYGAIALLLFALGWALLAASAR